MSRRYHWTAAGIVLSAFFLRFVGLGHLALIGDEAYYWLWSRHLDWAYYDHPGGVAWLIRFSTLLGGQSEFGIRWLNAAVGVGVVALLYSVGRRMLSHDVGLFAAAWVAFGGPYLVTGRFVYTDTLHYLCLLMNLYCFWRMLVIIKAQSRPSLQWCAALSFGVTLALLFNTKYSAYFYAIALGMSVLSEYHHLLRSPQFWVGITIGLLGLIPVLAWNASHQWASFRWQLAHFLTPSPGSTFQMSLWGWVGNVRHALSYLTWPLVSMGILGVGCFRFPAERLLSWLAFFLLAPVLFSLADSPRNLTTGLLMLLLLGAARLYRMAALKGAPHLMAKGILFLGSLAVSFYGIGTVNTFLGLGWLPHSSVVSELRADAAGWRTAAPFLSAYTTPFFALDYSLAGQITYYTGKPAYTPWGQYRIWGIPSLEAVTMVGRGYLPFDCVGDNLEEAFSWSRGPVIVEMSEGTSVLSIWEARGLKWNQAAFLQHFNFLSLLERCR